MTMGQNTNIYLTQPMLALFAKTAAPVVLVMLVNGLFTIVDAYFLGTYVGADAVISVTLMFPLYMMLVALSTLVSNGFSSIYARALGAGQQAEADQTRTGALQLALLVCLILMAGFTAFGPTVALWLANGSQVLAGLGHHYLAILIYAAPITFILAISVDALRAQGMLSLMAVVSMMSALLNIAFDWLFVVHMGWGVAGSAWGTVLAQSCSLTVILVWRIRRNDLRMWPVGTVQTTDWRAILALGAPSSLGYIGMALSAALTLAMLQIWATDHFEATSGAFGLITRLMTFVFLPLLGLSMAFQTITGNTFGAGDRGRTQTALRIALILSVLYCAICQVGFVLFAPDIGAVFVDDVAIQSEVARILPIATLTLVIFGPLMMTATYFQAIGDAPRAAILGLSRTYLFGLPLIATLPFLMGEAGIWYSGPFSEGLVLALTVAVLLKTRRRRLTPG